MAEITESELELIPERGPRRLHFEWLLPVLFRPARTLRQVTESDTPVWSAPLLLLSLLAIVLVLVSGPVRVRQAQTVTTEPPPDFQYWMPEQQEQYYQAQANMASPLFTYVFPGVKLIAGLWISWFLLGSLLHLGLTLAGSRSSNASALNLAAWASVPLAIRLIVQIVFTLATGNLVANPGLAGLYTPGEGSFPLFLRALLAAVDIYVIWRLVLLGIGAGNMAGLPRLRTWVVTIVVVLLLMALTALPSLIGGSLGGGDMIRPFFF